MTPQEFQAKWGVNRSQIASICNTSLGTVHHWFSENSKRNPSDQDMARLDEVDWLFDHWRSQDPRISELKTIYDSISKQFPENLEK